MIPFNKPYLTGREAHYMYDAVFTGQLSGNGKFTKKCQNFFEDKYGYGKCLLTTSCTDALEMASLLIDIQPGDEVIIPSYTFVSTANAFVLRGAKIVFADSRIDHPCIDEDSIEDLITAKTKAIIPVHYAGVSCNMEKIMAIADQHNLWVIEDAAQAIDNYYIDAEGDKKPLGSIGHLAAFSFHETKNVISGEGGMLVVNDPDLRKRAEIIWEKGTDRAAFFRGEVDKYGWVDVGSSYLPSEIIAAFLWAQIENLEKIQKKRKKIWETYNKNISGWADKNGIGTPFVPYYSGNNAHIYYLVFKNQNERNNYIEKLEENGIQAVFHYQSLHSSRYYKPRHDGRVLLNSDHYSDCLLRLPLFFELTHVEQQKIINTLTE